MTRLALVSVMSLLVLVHLSAARENNTQTVSCDDFECKPDYECVMVDLSCVTPPCRQVPSCRLDCNGTQCNSGSICQDGRCQPSKELFLDFCIVFFCSPGLHCVRGKCTAGPLCEGLKCAQEEECYVIRQRVCDSLGCDYVPTPVCEISDSAGHVGLLHYILGIAILYIFLMTNFCIYLAFKRCRRKRQVQPCSG